MVAASHIGNSTKIVTCNPNNARETFLTCATERNNFASNITVQNIMMFLWKLEQLEGALHRSIDNVFGMFRILFSRFSTGWTKLIRQNRLQHTIDFIIVHKINYNKISFVLMCTYIILYLYYVNGKFTLNLQKSFHTSQSF